MSEIPILPCVGGMDNVHDASHQVFQPRPGQGGMQPPERMRAIVDLDVDSDGTLTTRAGAMLVGVSFTDGRRLGQFHGQRIVQKGDQLFLGESLIANGLTNGAVFAEHADQLYWSDGNQYGRVQAGVAKNWGCAVCPTPTGQSGQRQVFASFVDSWGLEHGLSDPAWLSGVSVSIPYLDPSAAYVRFYVAEASDDIKAWVRDVPAGQLPATLGAAAGETQAWTHGFGPPPPPSAIISHRDSLVLASDNCLYPSLGAATHLYDMTLETALPETIQAGIGLPGGMWVVTTKDAYWVEGATPQQWSITPARLNCKFAKGAERYSSNQIPGLQLQTPTPIAIFVSEYGPVFGLPNGMILTPFRRRYHVNVAGKRMSVAFRDGEIAQMIFSVAP